MADSKGRKMKTSLDEDADLEKKSGKKGRRSLRRSKADVKEGNKSKQFKETKDEQAVPDGGKDKEKGGKSKTRRTNIEVIMKKGVFSEGATLPSTGNARSVGGPGQSDDNSNRRHTKPGRLTFTQKLKDPEYVKRMESNRVQWRRRPRERLERPSWVFEERGYHSEPTLPHAFQQRLVSLIPKKSGPKPSLEVKAKYVSLEDVDTCRTAYPNLVKGTLSDVNLWGYQVTEEMLDEWKNVADLEKNRESFFDKLFAKGLVADSLEVPRDPHAHKKLSTDFVDADTEHYKNKVEYGRMSFKTKNMYVGDLVDWYFHGKGKYTWTDGTSYEGEFANGVMHGQGRISWPNGCHYDGTFNNGRREGWGMYSNPQGITYIGDWHQGLPHGNGKMSYNSEKKDNDYYDGEWEHGHRHGKGTRQYPNGDRYIGQWVDGERSGEGTMIWLQASQVYRGSWEQGFPHGYGRHTWYLYRTPLHMYTSRHIYDGQWVEGKREGVGKMIYPCGSVYEGHWMDGQRHGKGFYVNPSGGVLTGLFRAGSILSGADIPLHVPTYEYDYGGLIEFLSEKFDLNRSDETAAEEELSHVTIRYLLFLRKLFSRAGELGYRWSEHGLYPSWLKTRELEHGHPKYAVNDEPVHMQGKDNKSASPDGVTPVTKFGMWLLLKDCPGLTDEVTLGYYDKHFRDVPSISFSFPHNPFEPVYLWQFVQCLVLVAVSMYIEIPQKRDKLKSIKVTRRCENQDNTEERQDDEQLFQDEVDGESEEVRANLLSKPSASYHGPGTQKDTFASRASKSYDSNLMENVQTGHSHHWHKQSTHPHSHKMRESTVFKKTKQKARKSLVDASSAESENEEVKPQKSKPKHRQSEQPKEKVAGDADKAVDEAEFDASSKKAKKTRDRDREQSKSKGNKKDAGKSKSETRRAGNRKKVGRDDKDELDKSSKSLTFKKVLRINKKETCLDDGITWRSREEERLSDEESATIQKETVFLPVNEQRKKCHVSIAQAFETLLVENLIPMLYHLPGIHLPKAPSPLPSLKDLWGSFQRDCPAGQEWMSGGEFLRTVLPHLAHSEKSVFWHRSPENLSLTVDYERLFSLLKTPEQLLSADSEQQYLVDEYLGMPSKVAVSKMARKEKKLSQIENFDDVNLCEMRNAMEFLSDPLSLSERDLNPTPFLWDEDEKCAKVPKQPHCYNNLTIQDVLGVLRNLYPNLVGNQCNTNINFRMIFCDWLLCICGVAEVSTLHELRARLGTQQRQNIRNVVRGRKHQKTHGVYDSFLMRTKIKEGLAELPLKSDDDASKETPATPRFDLSFK